MRGRHEAPTRARRDHHSYPEQHCSSTATQGSFDVAFGLFRGNVLTLVSLLSAFCNADQKLRSTFLEVDLQGNQRGSFRILGLGQYADFFPVGEERTYSQGIMLPVRPGRRVFSDMNPVQPETERLEIRPNPTFREARAAIANGLDLGAQKSNPALKGVPDEVIVSGTAVFNDHSVRIGLFSPFSHD